MIRRFGARHLNRGVRRCQLRQPFVPARAFSVRLCAPVPSKLSSGAKQRVVTATRCGERCMSSTTGSQEFKYLKQERVGTSLRITLIRPEVHNAFNEEVIKEITDAFNQVSSQSDLRSVVLTGDGPSFSAGADLNWMKSMAAYSKEENKADAEGLFDMVNAIKMCPVPTIARVNGAALGGGAGLVSACDIALSVDTAVFGFTEVAIGLIPAVISGFVMEKIGTANASRYFLTGERFKGKQAKQIGLVQDSFASVEDLDAEVEKIVARLEGNSPQAVKAAKVLIKDVFGRHPSTTKATVTEAIATIRVSSEGQEGLKSFLEKRKPNWTS